MLFVPTLHYLLFLLFSTKLFDSIYDLLVYFSAHHFIFIIIFILLLLLFFLLYNIVLVLHQHASATGVHAHPFKHLDSVLTYVDLFNNLF